jgi:antitoxin VapB
MTTARLFKLGNSQAVRIPARYRMKVREVEVFERDGELILRPKPRNAAELFARARAHGADWSDWKRPDQGKNTPVPSFD